MDWFLGILGQLAVWQTQVAAWLNRTFRLHDLALWLNGTDIKKSVNVITAANVYYLPLIQWVHIICIAIICGSIIMISLRMMGLLRWSPLADMTRRLLPWTWLAVFLNVVTGIFMVIDRPTRALDSGAFPFKILFLIVGTALSIYFALTLRSDPDYWEKSGFRRSAARVLGLVSLLLWVGVIVGGRWIFYSRLPNALILTPRPL